MFAYYLEETKRLVSGESWTPGERPGLLPLLFGEHCAPIRLVQQAVKSASAAGAGYWPEIEALIDALKNRPFRELVAVGHPGTTKETRDQCQHLAAGILSVLKVACQWAGSRDRVLDHSEFDRAVDSFDRASPNISFSLGGRPLPADSPLAEQLEANEKDTGGFWIAWDLLDRLLGASDQTRKIRQAQTPVLLTNPAKVGDVALLTVELIYDGNSGFCPDPLEMGLLCLMAGDQRHRNIQRSMQEVWKRAGLNRGIRGRWRVTAYGRAETEKQPRTLGYQCLEGRSLEAATLAAIWAAHGGIPDEISSGDASESLAMERTVAISACLSDEQSAMLSGLRLETVDDVETKLDAAKAEKLDTVLLAEKPIYTGLIVEPVETMGQAFDWLLIQNRIIRDHQKHVRQKWLLQWRAGTGRAPWDDGPDPRDEESRADQAAEIG